MTIKILGVDIAKNVFQLLGVKSITRARRAIPEILASQDNELTAMVHITPACAFLRDCQQSLWARTENEQLHKERLFYTEAVGQPQSCNAISDKCAFS